MIVKRSIGTAVVLFWCIMNVLLLRRQLAAPPPPIMLRAGESVTEATEEWWSVRYRGEKIGYASQSIQPTANGYRLKDQSVLHLNLLGVSQMASTRLAMEADKEWVLKEFDFDLQSSDMRFQARGSVAPGKLALQVTSAGNTSRHELPLSQPPYLLAALKPLAATQQLEPRKEHFFSIFDPATLSHQVATLVVEGHETIPIDGRREPTLRLRQRFKGLSVVAWIDGRGRTLKEESAGGFSILKSSPEEAKNTGSSRSLPLDLIAQSAVRPGSPIADPERRESLKLSLGGFQLENFSLDGGRQRLSGAALEIRKENLERLKAYSIPSHDRRLSAYLQPTVFQQSDHPAIRALARQIVGDETGALEAARRLKNWVHREIAKIPTVSVPNALEVLKLKRGDCNEHTVLFNALARAAGIPAKTVVGVTYQRGAFYYHAWSEVWLGAWVSLDATLDQFPADVTHVRFLEGEIDRQIDILQLIGNLKIEVVNSL